MFKRRLTKVIQANLEAEPHLVVTGARQVGKSTLLGDLLPFCLNQKSCTLSFDDPDLRLDLSKQAISKVAALKEPILVFDEVQKMPAIFDAIKYLIDQKTTQHFFLTGSSNILLLKNIQESLAGRIGLWSMFPLAFSELFDDRTDILLDQILADQKFLTNYQPDWQPASNRNHKELLALHQKWGGYPALFKLKPTEQKYRWLANYKKTYLEKDVRELAPGVDLKNITRFINLLAARTAQMLSYSDLARDGQVSVTTAQNYLKLFEITQQVYLLKPYFNNQSKRLVKSPKIYFLDTGLARVITQEFAQAELSGAMYETWVLTELIKWLSCKVIPPELYYFRTAAGFEVDFVLRYQGDKLLPIEVKNRQKIFRTDANNLVKFMRENPRAAEVGLIVYPGEVLEEIRERVWAVPDKFLFL